MKRDFIKEKMPVIYGYICVIFCMILLGIEMKIPIKSPLY